MTNTGTPDEWYSRNGDDWVDQNGHEITSPEFADAKIVLKFGPRAGETVS